MKMEREQIFIFSIFHRLLLRHLKYKVLKEARKSCQKKIHMKVKHSSNITQQYEKSGKFPGWGMTRWRNPCGVHAHGEHHPLLSTQDGPFASKQIVKFPECFHSFLSALLFPRGVPLLPVNERRVRHVFVFVPVLTHLGCSTMISMRTLASSFLLTKPINSSASSASTSTTGRGRESVSRSCVLYV